MTTAEAAIPNYDFACRACEITFEAQSRYEEGTGIVGVPCTECGAIAESIWLKAPGLAADGNISAEERVASIMKFGTDPNSRSQLNRLKAERGEFAVGKNALLADNNTEKPKFRLTEEQRRDAVQRLRQNRAQGAHDAWRMNYTKDPEVIKAANEAAKELAK